MVELESNKKYVQKRNTLTLAKCFLIKRQDGRQLAFTNHDKALITDGILFEPSHSVTASAAEQSIGLQGGNSQLTGFIATESLDHNELLAGLYDNARVVEYIVDWKYPFGGYFFKTEYVIVSMTYNNNFWQADMEGYSNILSNPVGSLCQRLCPYVFGSDECGVDTTLHTSPSAIVTDVTSSGNNTRQAFTSNTITTDNQYNLGTLVFTTGDNALYKYDIATNINDQVTLFLQTGFDIQVGDTFYMVQGCDRNHTTCRDRYSNIARFGGFPYIIGRDKMITRPDRKKS